MNPTDKSPESAAEAARGGFDKVLGNPSPGFDKGFKAFIALALAAVSIAFIQQLVGGIPAPEFDRGGNGGVSVRCSVDCGPGELGSEIPVSCGSCPSNTYSAGRTTRNTIQCVCR